MSRSGKNNTIFGDIYKIYSCVWLCVWLWCEISVVTKLYIQSPYVPEITHINFKGKIWSRFEDMSRSGKNNTIFGDIYKIYSCVWLCVWLEEPQNLQTLDLMTCCLLPHTVFDPVSNLLKISRVCHQYYTYALTYTKSNHDSRSQMPL